MATNETDHPFDQFLEFIEENETAQGELKALKGQKYDPYCAAVVEIGAKHGFTFDVDDVEEYVDELLAKKALQSGELSDEELEAIAGGAKAPPGQHPGFDSGNPDFGDLPDDDDDE